MRVAVTGVSGFVGRHVVAELLGRGHKVIASAISREEAASLSWFDRVQFQPIDLHGDIGDPFADLGRPDALIHLAWQGLPNYRELFHIEENLLAQYRFLRALIVGGLKHLVVSGTCLEYGLQNGSLSEDLPARPTTPYAMAKDFLRQMLVQLSNVHPFVLQWLRLFYIYGDGQHPNSLLTQLTRAMARGDAEFPMSGGEQLRDYLPIGEVANRIVRITEQTSISGIINCCSGNPISVRRLAEEWVRKSKSGIKLVFGSLPYPDYEPMAFWGDTRKWQQIEGMNEF